jgi:hypothetical protein
MRSRDFRSSKVNRDRRDQSFARSVIAEAERRRRLAAEIALACCCDGNDPACPRHGIAASNARQNDYWQRVGGHPDAGEVDGPDSERCSWCSEPMPNDIYAPYCSNWCAVQGETS